MIRAVLAVALLALAGCSSSTHVFRASTATTTTGTPTSTSTTATPTTISSTTSTSVTPSAESVYLAQLGAEQARLAAAETKIPTRPRTPAALRRSIVLLGTAVGALADGLAGIKPPPGVAAQHAHLISIMRTYAGTLEQAAGLAGAPGSEPRAAQLLISATSTASQAFTTTIAKIDSTLGRSPG
jgi:hypothetical protein